MAFGLGKMRWLMFEERSSSISMPLLAVLVFRLAIVFASFGLFAPSNATVITTIVLCALAVSGAIFLIVEMYTPFKGLIQISSCSAAQRPSASGTVAGGSAAISIGAGLIGRSPIDVARSRVRLNLDRSSTPRKCKFLVNRYL
jgi:hypothetical protein